MRPETIALLAMADAMKDYSRDQFLQDCEPLIAAKRYYTCEELAARYGVTIQTLKNWEKELRLVPDLRVGDRCVRYSAYEVDNFEKKHPGKGK